MEFGCEWESICSLFSSLLVDRVGGVVRAKSEARRGWMVAERKAQRTTHAVSELASDETDKSTKTRQHSTNKAHTGEQQIGTTVALVCVVMLRLLRSFGEARFEGWQSIVCLPTIVPGTPIRWSV